RSPDSIWIRLHRYIGIGEVLVKRERVRFLELAEQVRPLGSVSGDTLPAGKTKNDRKTGVKTPETVCLPPTDNGVQSGMQVPPEFLAASHRQLINIAELQDL